MERTWEPWRFASRSPMLRVRSVGGRVLCFERFEGDSEPVRPDIDLQFCVGVLLGCCSNGYAEELVSGKQYLLSV